MSNFTEEVRNAWCQYRLLNGIKQGEAADSLGIHQNTLSRWELKKSNLPNAAFNRVVSTLASAGALNALKDQEIDIVWVECPECAQSVPGLIGARKFHHCAACGEALGKLCDNTECHHLNRFTAKYCEACGAPLKTHNTNYQLLKDPHIRTAAENNNKPPKP